MAQMSRLQRDVLAPRGIGPAGLTERERDVLRLLADGLDTAEIAGQLAYSERTIKNIIHDLTTRLNLRNRSHAVAYAVKSAYDQVSYFFGGTFPARGCGTSSILFCRGHGARAEVG